MTLEVKDLGIGKLREQLARLSKLNVVTGVQDSEAREKHPNADATVGQVAIWVQFGTEDADGQEIMPARPFVDEGLSNIKEQARAKAKDAVRALINRTAATAEESLVPVGEMSAGAVRRAIDTSRDWAEPLAKSTIQRKGHDQPLLDTGTLRDSVTYTIRDERDNVLKKGTGLE